MARPKGSKLINPPEKMWELFLEYKEHVKLNPRIKVEYVGKDGDRVDTPLVTPLTMVGFEIYVGDLPNMPISLDQYFSNQDELYTDYMGVCTRVRKAIRKDQIEGGMVGQYNASITQRLNGLADKQQHEITAEPRIFNVGN